MPPTRTVFVCGNSVFMAALESSLAAVRGFHVERVDGREGDLVDCVRAQPPHCIIFEAACMSEKIAFSLLREFPGTDLIAVDPESHRVLLLAGQEQASPDTAGLVQLIQRRGLAGQAG